MVLRNLLFRNLVLLFVLVLALASGVASMGEASPFPDSENVFLPLVSKSLPVRVYEYQTYGSRGGEVWLIGEIVATSNEPAYDVKIEFKIYNSSGQQVASNTSVTSLIATLPGQLNPFHITTSFVWDEGITYEVIITGLNLQSDREYHPLTTSIISTQEWPSGTWVDIEVRNDGSVPLADIYGTVWNLWQGDPSSTYLLSTCLAPGGIVTFTDFLWGVHGTNINQIKAAAQGAVEPCEP